MELAKLFMKYKWFIFALILCWSFALAGRLYVEQAHASVIYSQTDYTNAGYSDTAYQYLGSQLSGTIDTIEIYRTGSSPYNACGAVSLWPTYDSNYYNEVNGGNERIYFTATDNCSTTGWHTATVTPTALNPNYHYWLNVNTTYNQYGVWHYSAADYWPSGQLENPPGSPWNPDTADIAFRLSGSPATDVNFTIDENDIFARQEVLDIGGTFNKSSLYDSLIIQIYNLGNKKKVYKTVYLGSATTTGTFTATTSLNTGRYNMMAKFYDVYTNTYTDDSFGSVNFLVGTTTPYEWPNGTSSNPGLHLGWDKQNVCNNIDTSSIIGSIECGFKKVVSWAVTPSDQSFESLQETYEQLQTQFPLSIYYDLAGKITDGGSLNVSTSSSSTLGVLYIPFRWAGQDTGHYLLQPSYIQQMPYFQTFYNTIRYLIYLFCAWAMLRVVLKTSKRE